MRAIKKPGQEVLPVAYGDDTLGEAVVFVDEVNLLVDAQARTGADVDLVPLVRS